MSDIIFDKNQRVSPIVSFILDNLIYLVKISLFYYFYTIVGSLANYHAVLITYYALLFIPAVLKTKDKLSFFIPEEFTRIMLITTAFVLFGIKGEINLLNISLVIFLIYLLCDAIDIYIFDIALNIKAFIAKIKNQNKISLSYNIIILSFIKKSIFIITLFFVLNIKINSYYFMFFFFLFLNLLACIIEKCYVMLSKKEHKINFVNSVAILLLYFASLPGGYILASFFY